MRGLPAALERVLVHFAPVLRRPVREHGHIADEALYAAKRNGRNRVQAVAA